MDALYEQLERLSDRFGDSKQYAEELIEELITIGDWVRFAISEMQRHECAFGQGCPDALCEARWLVASALHLPYRQLDAFFAARLTREERTQLAEFLWMRTRSKIPVAYLFNEAWLQEHAFYVDERVIIPRSLLAELLQPEALCSWLSLDPQRVQRVLELCTGSGCLAILAAEAFPHAEVVATDLSDAALEVAAINIESYGFADRIRLKQGDLYEALDDAQKRFDLILANPPYVTNERLAELPEEYRHEPQIALAGGPDGMQLVRRIIADAPSFLAQGGIALVEVGHNAEEAQAMLEELLDGKLDAIDWIPCRSHERGVFRFRP